jgi:hypothetical protein
MKDLQAAQEMIRHFELKMKQELTQSHETIVYASLKTSIANGATLTQATEKLSRNMMLNIRPSSSCQFFNLSLSVKNEVIANILLMSADDLEYKLSQI